MEDRRGGFLLVFALLLIPLIGVLGISVDYALANKTKTSLDAATDAALLAAATTASQIIQAQSTPNYDATPAAEQQGALVGQAVFQADTNRVRITNPVTLNISWANTGGLKVVASGTYTGLSTNIFGPIFHTPSWQVAGSATAEVDIPAYINIYMLIDISESMGIASTTQGQSQLVTLTPDSCQLGCHTPLPGRTVSDESIAEANGIDLRIDAARRAVQDIIASANNTSSGTPRIQLALYTMSYSIAQLGAMTSNYSTLSSAAQSIDLSPWATDNSGPGYTNNNVTLPSFTTNTLPVAGDGTSAANPEIFVFLMTDGVTDVFNNNCTDQHCTAPFNIALCNSMKNKGAKVGVIYTTYVPVASSFYTDEVQPFASQIQPAMSACATSGYYFEATSGPQIESAATALFAAATSEGRLTN